MTTKGEPLETSRHVDFDRPPVVETLIGLQFAPIRGWSVIHLGLLWNALREDYPQYQVQPPVSSLLELRLDVEPKNAGKPLLEFQSELQPRAWFFDRSETRLIQVQNNAFIHNWRKTIATQQYQHYDVIRPIFEREWDRFCGFLRANQLPAPQVWQCEVTYVNHVVRGEGWKTFSDLPALLTLWRGKTSGNFLPPPEVVSLNAVFPIRDSLGHLKIVAQPAVRQSDSTEVLQLTLSARGKPHSSSPRDLLAWLDIGHEWVVRGFKDVTTSAMHDLWGVR